jgi:hypothetical protein
MRHLLHQRAGQPEMGAAAYRRLMAGQRDFGGQAAPAFRRGHSGDSLGGAPLGRP